jgi:RNA polymerase sigma-70 factor (sigma-E family)
MEGFAGFREFVQARGPALTRTAFLLTGDRAAAEDLVQAALVKAAVRWRRLVAGGDPEAYLRRIMINEQISGWRRRGRHEVAMPDPPDPGHPDPAEATARRLDLASALARLAPRQRAVIVLRFYEDLSEADTAALLGCAIGTVKSQTADALARLRRLLPGLVDESMGVSS